MIHALTRATSTRERYKIIQLSEKSTPRLVKIGYKQKIIIKFIISNISKYIIYHKQSRPHRQLYTISRPTSFSQHIIFNKKFETAPALLSYIQEINKLKNTQNMEITHGKTRQHPHTRTKILQKRSVCDRTIFQKI